MSQGSAEQLEQTDGEHGARRGSVGDSQSLQNASHGRQNSMQRILNQMTNVSQSNMNRVFDENSLLQEMDNNVVIMDDAE